MKVENIIKGLRVKVKKSSLCVHAHGMSGNVIGHPFTGFAGNVYVKVLIDEIDEDESDCHTINVNALKRIKGDEKVKQLEDYSWSVFMDLKSKVKQLEQKLQAIDNVLKENV